MLEFFLYNQAQFKSLTEINCQVQNLIPSNSNNNGSSLSIQNQPQQTTILKQISQLKENSKQKEKKGALQYTVIIDNSPIAKQKCKKQQIRSENFSIKTLDANNNIPTNNNLIQVQEKNPTSNTTILIENEQLINPIPQSGVEQSVLCAGELKDLLNHDNQSQIQSINKPKSRLTFNVEDSTILKKRSCSSQNAHINNQDDVLQLPAQEETKHSIDKRLSVDSESYNKFITKLTQKQYSLSSLDLVQLPKFENERINSYQTSESLSQTQIPNLRIEDLGFTLRGLNEFDKGMDYDIYFPHNNMTKILIKMELYRKRITLEMSNKRLLKIKKKKRSKQQNLANKQSAIQQIQNLSQMRKNQIDSFSSRIDSSPGFQANTPLAEKELNKSKFQNNEIKSKDSIK